MDPSELEKVRLWVAADKIEGLADGAAVSEWKDLSGEGNHLTSEGADRPTYKTGIQNELPIVRFENDVLRNKTFEADLEMAGCFVFMVYAVRKNPGGFRRLLSFVRQEGTGQDDYEDGLAIDLGEAERAVDDYLNILGNKNTVANVDYKTSENALGTFTRATVDYFNSGVEGTRLWVDGVAQGSRNAVADVVNAGQIRVGRGYFSKAEQTGPDFDLAELIVVEDGLTTEEREGIEKYLLDKWFAEPAPEEVVRHFDPGDTLALTVTDKAPPESLTWAAVARINAAPEANAALLAVVGKAASGVLRVNPSGQLEVEQPGGSAASEKDVPIGHWCLLTGGGGLFGIYDFDEEKWVEQDGAGSMSIPDLESIHFGEDGEGGEKLLDFDIAAAAVWKDDFTVEDEEGILALKTLWEWVTLRLSGEKPWGFWLFDQASIEEAVKDLTGNGTDQTAISGTEVLKEAPPTPYGSPIKAIAPPPMTAMASMLAPTLAATGNTVTIAPPAMVAAASFLAPLVAAGANISPSAQPGGLHLPFPSILANPNRLGPPRLNTLEKKRLGIK